jgi:hypothetical protein
VATVGPTPTIDSATKTIPYNIPQLQLSVSNIDQGVRPDEIEIIFRVGDGVRCPVISITNGSVICNTTVLNSILSDYRAPLTAQIYRASGPSSPAVVATIVGPPTIDPNGATITAVNSPVLSIYGSNFGGDLSSLSVILRAQSLRRAPLDVIADIISVTDTQLVVRVPNGAFAPGSSVLATVYLSGAPSQVIVIAQIVSAPALTPNTAYRVAANAPTIIITGSSFATSLNSISATLTSGNRNVSCRITATSLTRVDCSLSETLSVGPLFASIVANGGASNQAQIAEVVPSPTVRESGTASIKLGATEISIIGENFNSVDPSANVVGLSYTGQDGPTTKACTITSSKSTSQLLVCALSSASDLNVAGSLFARVESFGGRSNWTQIGVVTELSGVAGLSPGATAAIVVVVVALLIIVVVGAVLGYRYVKGIRERNQQMVPKEMEYMFNIRASDLQILSKLGEGSFGAVYFGKYKGRHVAIKKLAASVLGNQVADFFREAALQGAVPVHPYAKLHTSFLPRQRSSRTTFP